jgi:hypothetical protein
MNSIPELPPSSRPFYKNPYVIAALIGIALITISRPLMQNIPLPPPAINILPPLTLNTLSNHSINIPDPQQENLWVFYTFDPQCGPSCEAIHTRMSRFAERIQRESINLRIVALLPPSTADQLPPSSPLIIPAKTPPTLRSLFPPLSTSLSLSWLSPFAILVDHQGLIRGHYSCDDTGLDELFHRSKHLLTSRP